MKIFVRALLGASALSLVSFAASATDITVATVNNGDMIRMQGLMDDFYAKHPDIKVNWVTLEENALRQQVTTDIATGGGQFDVLTIGTYEVPIWAKQGWLVSLDDLPASYDINDLLPPIRAGLSYDGKLYASPFYGESSFVTYRTDLAEKAGVTIPEKTDLGRHQDGGRRDERSRQMAFYGICLRGKPGWGENTRPSSPRWPIPTARAGSIWNGIRSSTPPNGRRRWTITWSF